MPFTTPSTTPPSPPNTIYFCMLAKKQEMNDFKYKRMVDSVVHGIMKIITFSSLQTKQLSSCAISGGCLYADDTKYTNLKSLFKQNFKNSQYSNMPVVSQTPNNYFLWSKQYAFDDLMTDNYGTENKFWSAFNNQILKDNPLFYSVNDSMKQQITIPLSGSDDCSSQNELFCTSSQQSLSCNASLTAKSYCKAIDNSPNSCMVYQITDKGNCLDPQLNQDLADLITKSGTYEYYGYNSRCFLSDIQDISAIAYIAPVRCYKYSCDASNNVYIYLDQSANGNQPNIDIVTCTVQMQGTQQLFSNQKYYSKTGITCPKNNANFCQGLPKQCKNYCSQKGVCINGKCKCVKNYYGDDCSCFQQSQENGKCVQSCSKKMTQANDGSQICVPKCQDGYFFQTTNGQCQKCDQNCKTCWDTSNNCDSCDTANGYILFTDNTCRQSYPNQKCQKNQYYDGAKCSSCSSGCQSCTINSTFCTSCLSNQFLLNGTCQNCPSNCLACSGIQLCTQCALWVRKQSSGINWSFECIACSLQQKCNQCLGSPTYCTDCLPQFYLLESDCLTTCTNAYYADDSQRKCIKCDPTCLTCSNSSKNCTSCAQGFYLKGGQCVTSCGSGYVPNNDTLNCDLALQIQSKPKVSTILISYLVCALYYLLNPYTLSKFNQVSIDDRTQSSDSSNSIIASQEDAIPYIILQFIAQDYFIYTSVRLFFHDSFIRKIEVKDLLITFWLLYGCSTLFLVFILTCIQSHWMNMLIFTFCYSVLIFQYQKEQNSFKNLFQMSRNFEQLLRSSRRRRNQNGEEAGDENQQNGEQQDQQQNVNNQNAQAGLEYDSDDQDEQNHNEAIRLNQRRVNFSNHRANPIVTELVQQFVGEHYERNQVSQLIQVSSSKFIVIYNVNHIKYASIFAGKSRLSTQKIDSNYIILKYYSESIEKQASPQSSSDEVKKKYINIGVIYNTFSGKLLLFTVTPKGIKYLQTLDVGIVNKEHLVLHQQQPKFVTIRLKDLIFKDFIKNGMSSQTLVDYQNRVLQAYYSIDDTDYVVSVEEETLIINTILSRVEWKPIGHDWEMELMMGNHEPSNHLSPAQSTLLKNHQYYDKSQYFIQQTVKTKDFPTSIKSVNILNKRHLFIQDETHFYVYSIPTSQILNTLPNNYIQGFSIIPINSTINSPKFTIQEFLKVQNFVQKRIAETLASEANIQKNSAITTENPTLIYLTQYKSIPITLTYNQDKTIQKIIFILPKCIQSTTESAIQTENLFQIKSNSLQSILESNSQ
ncbi:hypothetical protein ABPG74_003414 [Tetrahymena malaccensis]